MNRPTAAPSTGSSRNSFAPSGFIAGPTFDLVLIILAPLWAALFGFLVSQGLPALPLGNIGAFSSDRAFWSFMVFACFTEAHLVLALFRSHLNAAVFARNRWRFTVIPVAVFLLGATSSWALVAMAVLATWWDVYHSALQTFGFARIYDAKASNDPRRLRRLDLGLNLVIYVGPILAGATFLSHVRSFEMFSLVESALFSEKVPVFLESHAGQLSRAVLLLSVAYLFYYVLAYARAWRSGYQVSGQKILLLVATAATTIYAWYFNAFGVAFLVVNLFHAVQYYAIVYFQERDNVARRLHLGRLRLARPMVLGIVILTGVGYGLFASVVERDLDSRILWSAVVTVALMHFWYDGFIWSVTRRHVALASGAGPDPKLPVR